MILFISAHNDDMELGAGATAYTMTDKVGITLTSHSAFLKLLPEMQASWDILGVKYNANFKQNFRHRDMDRAAVLDYFIQLRDELQPEIVFTHSSFCVHPDHKVVHDESVRAFKHSTILGYSLPWNDVKGSDYRYFYKLNEEAVEKKLEALACYKSQAHRTYFNPEYQRALMITAGQQCGHPYAEKFEVIRYVDNHNSR